MSIRNYFLSPTLSILFAFIFGCFAIGYSQTTFLTNEINMNGTNSFVHFSTEGGYDSDGIQSGLLRSFFKGGFIDRETRENSIPDEKLFSRMGGGIEQELRFSFPAIKITGKDSLNLFFSVSQEKMYAADFNQTLYNLLFFGNKMYAGDSLTLDPMRYDHWNIRSIGIGVFNLKNSNSLHLSFYQGINRSNYYLDQGTMYVSEDGSLLNLGLQGSAIDNIGIDSSRTKGLGIGINGHITMIDDPSNVQVYFDFSNIGIMFWNQGMRTKKLGNIEGYHGVILDDLLSEEGTSNNESIEEQLWADAVYSNKSSEMLPAKIKLSILKNFNPTLQLVLSLSNMQINQWRPEVTMGLQKEWNKKLSLAAVGKYGGYGGANVNIYGSYLPSKYWAFHFHLNNISGWVSRKGYGSYLGLGITRFIQFNTSNE